MIDWVHSLWLIVFNATFNHILWCSVLLVAETRVPGENHSRLAVYYFLEIVLQNVSQKHALTRVTKFCFV
jgi:hypothetical protein